ncbi:unnamed protein product [Rhizoctonia solani]|uniref:Uncharacterized protein n=1 Tax=Rhizoctonia solani TaxID=456999 RepID=A0A8H3AW42_9AGAM|nr:unnamed protein product [Rhizoctonia solani]
MSPAIIQSPLNFSKLSAHSSNQQLSTPPQSPRSSFASVEDHLGDLTIGTEDVPNLLISAAEAPLPGSPSDASPDSVGQDLNDQLFELQLGSTEYHFARDQLKSYEELSRAQNFQSLGTEDRTHLLELQHI